MTREEAIERIKDHMEVHRSTEPRAIYITEALNMAIKALEQQDRIAQILDDCDLEAWEVLEMIKEVVRA